MKRFTDRQRLLTRHIEFVIQGDSDTYVDLVLKLFVKGNLQTEDDTDLPESFYTAVINNLLHSLFSQCTIFLNGTETKQATELYPYRAYIETLSTYGNDAANSHLTMPYWLLDEGNVLGGDCSKLEQKITADSAPDETDLKKVRP